MIVALYECGKIPKEIRQTLIKLSINERFISRTLHRYRETGDVLDRPREGCPRSVRTPKLIHAVCEWVRRNLLQKQKRLAGEMKVSNDL